MAASGTGRPPPSLPGLADQAGASLKEGIDQAVATGAMSASDAIAARGFARVLGSAIRAAGNPDDPRHAFATDFLEGAVREALPELTAPGSNPAPGRSGEGGAVPPQTAEAPPVPPSDPFLTISDDDDPSRGQLLADELGMPREGMVDAGLLDDARRSFDLLSGFVEGAGFSVLEAGHAVVEIARSHRQFIGGVEALLTSAEARAQFGEAVVNRVRADLLLLEDAWNAGDMRGIGQQLGKLTADIVQVAGGVEALARLGISTASAGGRLLLGAADATAGGRAATGAVSGLRETADAATVIRQADAAARQAAERLRDVGLVGREADSLVENLARNSTRGSGDRVVLGRSVEGGGYVREAVENGGVYFHLPEGVYQALGSNKELAWAVNQRVLLDQLRAGVGRIDFVGESIAYVESAAVGSSRWREVQFLRANAPLFGYELRGNSWVRVGT